MIAIKSICIALALSVVSSVTGLRSAARLITLPTETDKPESYIEMQTEDPASRGDEGPPIDQNEVDLLARLIYQEAGCDWIPDYVILWVGSVALNRVNSDKYPDTLYDVVYQPGQYEPAITGSINYPANERCIRLAEQLLTDGSQLPPNVLGQCGWPTGSGVYATYYDEVLDTTIYFCTID